MLRFKHFEENIFKPKRIDSREECRIKILQESIKKERENYLELKRKNISEYDLLDYVIDDIFYIWDLYVDDDREGIEHGMQGKLGEKSKNFFHFTSDDNFIEHVKLFLDVIECKYTFKQFPGEASIVLEGITKFTS